MKCLKGIWGKREHGKFFYRQVELLMVLGSHLEIWKYFEKKEDWVLSR